MMENLSIHDPTPLSSSPAQQGPPAIPQLPPQMFTTAASLLDLTDSTSALPIFGTLAQRFLDLTPALSPLLEKLMVALRDGKKIIGVLRSWDQFGNLVLQDSIERIFAQNLYADIPKGVYLVRGENIMLMGEIDLDKDDYVPPAFEPAPADQVHALLMKENEDKKTFNTQKQKTMRALGFEGEQSGEALY